MSPTWLLERVAALPGALLEPPPSYQRAVRILEPAGSAVVLGSTQPEAHVDRARAAAAGLAVVRRRSGGGAVLVGPGRTLWVDVVIPKGDPLWSGDVGQSFWWLGEVWASSLAAVEFPGAEVWHGGLVRTPWSDRVCFAGLGPGEVTGGGAKVVGLAQRRTREGAHFQCAVPITWDPGVLVDVLALDDASRAEARRGLAGTAAGVGPGIAGRLTEAFYDRLP